MADRRRSGIVGTGFIGEVHARAVRAAGGVVAAVAGRDAKSSAAAATRLRAARAASSAEELIEADDVDVIHICTPNHLHAPLTGRALAAGKHVICEKSLSTDVSSSRSLALLAASAFVTDVYAAVAGDTPDGLPPFDDGLRAAVVTDAVLTSAASGGWVEVPA
ncbi:hypothetical protein ALI22I_04960 [Saccharothrix sp. ALI-22-I]|uniref:Gfo/Idh/MocA family oxidoreductase n=1 Tax=Saccharothrix sp. ALI-22-I TaxID=1933778 RepID=UPI00097CA7E7|nr:Gfo/Idh/MocA family oxidoreductase [Saccharothrix sp. ALI-22-I]ONI92291.1 hypothetical protein ALI22I_04960 [Saccharothrix sp. ALI-22-I]